MTTTPLDDLAAYTKSVKPAVARCSDKYSWLLFRYLKRAKRPDHLRVLAHQGCRADNKTFRPFSKDNAQPAQLFIGFMDDGWGCGAFLDDIIGARIRVSSAAFSPCVFVYAVDVTDWFWPVYQRIGRCIWDMEHDGFMADTRGRFQVEPGGKARVCNWCGQRQTLVTKIKRIRERTWVKEAA